ncbi:MAG: pectinesterase family protein [Janthinobacterium lividum]
MKKIVGFILCFTLLLLVKTASAQPVPYPYPKLLTVAQDGSGNFKTIQEAVNAVRDLSQEQVTIRIKKGIYYEKLIIPSWKINIALVGEDKENTIISNNNYSGQPLLSGKDASGRTQYNTYTSYTVLVQGRDFSAENLTIENTAGRVGQAVALHVEGDRCTIKNCKLLGNQDTLYTGTESRRQYYQNCYIEGTTDFIFGEATVIFQSCTIKSLTNSYITAASTTPRQKFGYVFFDCKLIADSAAKKVFLGRPWRPYAKTVFIRTEMGGHILPAGWDPWINPAKVDNTKTTFYAEFKSTGTGAKTGERVKWSHQLTASEAKTYTLANIFAGKEGWNPLQNKN